MDKETFSYVTVIFGPLIFIFVSFIVSAIILIIYFSKSKSFNALHELKRNNIVPLIKNNSPLLSMVKIKECQYGDKVASAYKLRNKYKFPDGRLDWEIYIDVPLKKDYGKIFLFDIALDSYYQYLKEYPKVDFESHILNNRYKIFAENNHTTWRFFSPAVIKALNESSEPISISLFPDHMCFFFQNLFDHDEKIDKYMDIVRRVVIALD